MNTLTINFQEGDLPSLHPHELIIHLRGICASKMLFEGLTRMDENGKIRLAGAESVEISMDKLHYIFTLRKNFWSDGTLVTAFQYERAWKAALTPNSSCPRADLLYMIKNGEKAKKGEAPLDTVGVKAIDDMTLVVDLEYPSSYFLDLLIQPICVPLIDPADKTPSAFNGPFCLASWNRNNVMRLKKNPHFWNSGKVSLNQVDIFMMEDSSTILNAYENGLVDWIGMPIAPLTAEQLHLFEKRNELISRPVDRVFWIHLNVNHPALKSSKIRHALSLALDREAITQYIMIGGHPLQRSVDDAILPIKLRESLLLKEDQKEARIRLQEGLLELGISKEELAPITISYAQQSNRKQFAEYLKQRWRDVLGIDVRTEQVEWNVLRVNLPKGQFDVCATFKSLQYNDPITLLERLGSPHPENFSQWMHGGYQQLINLARREPDSQRSCELLAKAEEVFLRELPVIPVCTDQFHFCHRDGLKGYIFDSGGKVDFSYASWKSN